MKLRETMQESKKSMFRSWFSKLLKNDKTSPLAKAFVSGTASPVARLICDAKLIPIADIVSISRFGTRVLNSSGKASIHLQQKDLLFTKEHQREMS